MAKIISIGTRQELGGQDYAENTELITNRGRYLGALPSSNTVELRKIQDELICKQAQINELIEEFDEHYKDYLHRVTEVLLSLGFNPIDFNPEAHQLFIGEDGNVWVVKE